jgi:hypothetical protein
LIQEYTIREFKLHVSGQQQTAGSNFLPAFSLNIFVSYFLSCVDRVLKHIRTTVIAKDFTRFANVQIGIGVFCYVGHLHCKHLNMYSRILIYLHCMHANRNFLCRYVHYSAHRGVLYKLKLQNTFEC